MFHTAPHSDPAGLQPLKFKQNFKLKLKLKLKMKLKGLEVKLELGCYKVSGDCRTSVLVLD